MLLMIAWCSICYRVTGHDCRVAYTALHDKIANNLKNHINQLLSTQFNVLSSNNCIPTQVFWLAAVASSQA